MLHHIQEEKSDGELQNRIFSPQWVRFVNEMLDPPNKEAIVCIKVKPRYTAQVYKS